jgi:hypothetical protein
MARLFSRWPANTHRLKRASALISIRLAVLFRSASTHCMTKVRVDVLNGRMSFGFVYVFAVSGRNGMSGSIVLYFGFLGGTVLVMHLLNLLVAAFLPLMVVHRLAARLRLLAFTLGLLLRVPVPRQALGHAGSLVIVTINQHASPSFVF